MNSPRIQPAVPSAPMYWATAALVLFSACASSQKDSDIGELQPYVRAEGQEKPIGPFLTDLDLAVRGWNNLTLSADNEADRRKAKLLAEDIAYRARKREEELLAQLETGPPFNRMVAAAALGFGSSDKALGPLLAALEDPEPLVVSNALMGLAVLGRSETPVGGIVDALAAGPSPRIRNNAAWALRKVQEAGADVSSAQSAARDGLLDPDPAVRSQCCLLLARLEDVDSMDRLDLLVHDDVHLVAMAAARSLAYLGTHEPRVKGRAARSLAAALDKVDELVRRGLIKVLTTLAGRRNYGQDSEPWVEWANRLP